MDEDFMEYVYRRCDVSLVEDEQYRSLQSEQIEAMKKGDINLIDKISSEMESREQKICFIAGFKAAMNLALSLNRDLS